MKRVVIIGAGPAGLSAAYKLLDSNYEVIVLEATDEIGGISKTVTYKGNKMDMGGHRFFSKSKEVNEFWNSFMEIDKCPTKKNKVFLKRDRVSRIYYNKKFFDYPVTLKYSTIKNLGIFKTIECGFSYIKSCIFKKREDNLENFYINRFGKSLYFMFFKSYTTKLWGRAPSEIDASWGAQRVKGLSIRSLVKDMFYRFFHIKKSVQETSLIDEFIYPKYGPGYFWEEVASCVEKKGGIILKNSKVVKINRKKNKIKSVECEDGTVYECDILLSSMAIKDLINCFDDVPKNICNIATNLPYRDFITLGVLVKKLNIEVPDDWIYVQEPDIKMGRIQIFNNWSPYMVNKKNTVWLGLEYFAQEGDNLWNMTEDEFSDFAISELVKMGLVDKENVIDTHEEKVPKAYPAYFDSYEHFDEVKNYLNKIDNLYCIGRNGQHRYNNMDHSMLTAFKAVELIKNKVKDKTELWNINTEKVYHELDQKK